MKPIKSNRNLGSPQSNIIAKSKKLTIDVPADDELDSLQQKFNKNSPISSKIAFELQKSSGCILAPKHKSPSNPQSTKRSYGETDSPKINQKMFKFPSTPKIPIKTQTKSYSSARSQIQPKNIESKYSATPTHAKQENSKRRPRTASDKKINPESNSLSAMITQVKQTSISQNNSDVLHKEHLFQTFQAMKFVKNLQPVNIAQLKEKRVVVPWKKGYEGKKTIVFDLDETLVHCCEDLTLSRPDVILPVTFPSGEVVQAGINIRPFAIECLKEANKDFEVFVFTASHPCYANTVLNYLDPEKEMIHQRFFRDSCINVNGVYLKDLRIFANRNLKDIAIVDNAAYSFGYQLDNGIPIVSWHNDPNDRELFNLIEYMKVLVVADDVREVNDRAFKLRSFYNDYIREFMAGEDLKKARRK